MHSTNPALTVPCNLTFKSLRLTRPFLSHCCSSTAHQSTILPYYYCAPASCHEVFCLEGMIISTSYNLAPAAIASLNCKQTRRPCFSIQLISHKSIADRFYSSRNISSTSLRKSWLRFQNTIVQILQGNLPKLTKSSTENTSYN